MDVVCESTLTATLTPTVFASELLASQAAVSGTENKIEEMK